MATAITATPPASALTRRPASTPGSVWHAPLVPLALAVTAGVVADRYAGIPLPVSLLVVVVCLAAWVIVRRSARPGLPLLYLAVAAAATGAAYHRWQRDVYPADDVGNYATDEARPAHVRGVIEEEPVVVYRPAFAGLRSFAAEESTRGVLSVTQLRTADGWLSVSGRAQLLVTGTAAELHVGDEVEVVGRLQKPQGPANPGEFDYAARLRDDHIRAILQVRKTPDGVVQRAEGWPRSLRGWLGKVHAWCQRRLQEALPPEQGGVAIALLLGDGSPLTNEDWDKYVRTGVIHVLAISGQHLVVLGAFLWLVLRLLGVRRRQGAVLVALFLLGYALMVGGRPPVMRSAVTVCAVCGGLLLRRQVMAANSFALAWLLVAILNPTDLFNAGCQLSFLSVAVLYWGVGRWLRRERDPLEELIEASRPASQRALLWVGRQVALAYSVSLVISLAVAPLVASRYHLISPAGPLLGPPLVLLTSVALIAGFLLLLSAAVCPVLVPVFAWPVRWSLAGCDWLVQKCDGWCLYVGDVPEWWLWGCYVALLAVLLLEPLYLRRRWAVTAGLGWLCLGLLTGWALPAPDELRCTFLAVGHGGCTVLETPDGRVLLYDAGALGGPDVTRRQIAPFLWSRGIRRIDEVFLSHADLDHFNGLPALLDRFAVGQVTLTPSFRDKRTPGAELTLAAIGSRGVPVRIAQVGDQFVAGEVGIDVLHPPGKGPDGNENARSLVLLIRHAGRAILLTGDLEGPGLDLLLATPPQPVDVLMAPHHGSRFPNTPQLADWARPQVVIACQGPPRGPSPVPALYTGRGARYLGTWPHGAVTVRSRAGELAVETFVTGQRFTLAGDSP